MGLWALDDYCCHRQNYNTTHVSFVTEAACALAVAVLSGPQPRQVPLVVHGDGQDQLDSPVRYLALADSGAR